MSRRFHCASSRSALVFLVVSSAVAGTALAQVGYRVDPNGKDELWDVTSKMEMAGMPFAMPGQTSRVCVEKGNDEAAIPRQEGCTLIEGRRAGNRYVYKMACKSAKNDYVAEGENSWSAGGYDGTMRMVGKMDGEQVDMKMSYSGKRAGNCVSTIRQDMAKMQADAQAQGEKACRDMMDRLQWQSFEPKAACAAKRSEFAAVMTRVATEMRDPVQHAAYSRKVPDIKGAFVAYSMNYEDTTKAACARAVETRNYAFIGSGSCDADVLARGRGVCDRRDRSPDEEFRPMCARYATLTRGRGTGFDDAPTAAGAAAPKPASRAPAPADATQQTIDAVRKLLPF